MKRWLPLLLLLFCPALNAATIYVDFNCGSITVYDPTKAGAARCSGGSDRSYATLTNAFGYSGLAGDDHIQIRGSHTYDENAVLSGKSGTSGHVITIEPYAAETPVIRYTGSGSALGAIQLQNSSYITVSGLQFTGTGINVSRYAIWVRATSADVNGVTVTGNTITNWAGQNSYTGVNAIRFSQADATAWQVKNSTISNNTITGAKDSIVVFGAANVTISGNEISGNVCGTPFTNATRADGIIVGSNNSGAGAALNSTGITISGNTIHDFVAFASCGIINTSAEGSWSGMHIDSNVDSGTISDNTVYNISQAKTTSTGDGITASGATSVGIEVEARCDSWVVSGNIVHHIGLYGIQSSSGTHDNTGNSIIGNAVYNTGRYALYAPNTFNLTAKNNALFVNSPVSGYANIGMCDGSSPCSSDSPRTHSIDYNDYWDSSAGVKVGVWTSSVLTFANWKTACGCDSHSLNVNPTFVNLGAGTEDFHLQAGSALIDAGDAAVDMGAYPTYDASPPIQILVTYPNGREFWLPGETRTITWQSNDTGAFMIELTRDNGTTYETITASTNNDSSYDYVVTAGASSNCKIRVSSVATPSSLDTSDAVFRTRGFYTGATP